MIIDALILFLLPFVMGLFALRFTKSLQKQINFILALSGAYLFGITIVHLLPKSFEHATTFIPLWVVAGFTLQLFLDFLSRGVEHGHVHEEHKVNPNLIFSIMAGLSIHAFLEGIPLGAHDAGHHHVPGEGFFHVPLLMGIALHKIPAAFALMVILGSGGIARKTSLICLTIFSLMSPLAYLLTEYTISEAIFPEELLMPVLALVAGSFMHISTTIIFEVDSSGHHVSRSRLAAIILGLVLAVIPLFF